MHKLHIVLLGCTPKGRNTEQHDVFFGIAQNINELQPHYAEFWPEAAGQFHMDAWRAITKVGDFAIEICERTAEYAPVENKLQLYFLNLGGYKPGVFEELHHKMVVVASSKADAIKQAKKTEFYKECSFPKAVSHVDDQYGVDVDELHIVEDILPEYFKSKYAIKINPLVMGTTNDTVVEEDEVHIGYMKLRKK